MSRVPQLRLTNERALTSEMAAEFILHQWRVSERILDFYPSLRRARELVDRRYAEKLTLAEVARAAGLEKKYFSAYFRAKAGIQFRHWVASVRLREAIRLMSEQDDGLTSIASEAGFQDMRTFERTCKRLTGRTPREIKRELTPTLEPVRAAPAA